MSDSLRGLTEKVLDRMTGLAEKIIGKVFKSPPGPLDSREKVSELVSYCVFGALTTLVSFVSYLILAALFRLDEYGKGDRDLLSLLSSLFSGSGENGSYVLYALLCQLGSWVCAVKKYLFLSAAYFNHIYIFPHNTFAYRKN